MYLLNNYVVEYLADTIKVGDFTRRWVIFPTRFLGLLNA